MAAKDQILKLISNPDKEAMVQNIALMYAKPPVRRFIGWKLKYVGDDDNGNKRYAFIRKDTPEIVDYHHDYVQAVKKGDLLPADEETARICGVSYKS